MSDLSNVAIILPSLLMDSEIMNGIGALAFTKPDGKVGKIFLKQGNVYAVDNLEYEAHLWNELRFEDLLSHNNLRPLIRSNKSQRDSLYKILRKNRGRQDNEQIVNVLKEYVLGALDDIYMWEQVEVEWRMGDRFLYEAGHIPDLPLSRLITIVVNRAFYKYQRFENWGFKNDEQFAYGQVAIDISSAKKSQYAPKTGLDNLILEAKKFVIKDLSEGSGYSLYTIITALDELSENYNIVIENPYGRHIPPAPPIPQGMEIAESRVSFSQQDEEVNEEVFTREYTIPEAAKLEVQETFHDFSENEIGEPTGEVEESYDEAFNDAEDEIETNLPEIERPKLSDFPARRSIPESELRKEYEAQEYLEELYEGHEENDSENDDDGEEPVEIQQETPNEENDNMSDDTKTENVSDDLLGLVAQLQASLQKKKYSITQAQEAVAQKEEALRAAKAAAARAEDELGKAVTDRETATSDYDQALKVITNLR